jgi:hypothetical protein
MSAQQTTRISLILPNDLYDRVKAAAEQDRRSAHAEILTFIEYALDARERKGGNAA